MGTTAIILLGYHSVAQQYRGHQWHHLLIRKDLKTKNGSALLTCAGEQEVQVVPYADDAVRLRHGADLPLHCTEQHCTDCWLALGQGQILNRAVSGGEIGTKAFLQSGNIGDIISTSPYWTRFCRVFLVHFKS